MISHSSFSASSHLNITRFSSYSSCEVNIFCPFAKALNIIYNKLREEIRFLFHSTFFLSNVRNDIWNGYTGFKWLSILEMPYSIYEMRAHRLKWIENGKMSCFDQQQQQQHLKNLYQKIHSKKVDTLITLWPKCICWFHFKSLFDLYNNRGEDEKNQPCF